MRNRRGRSAIRSLLIGRRADLALLAVSLVWGATFVMVRDAVALVPPLTFLALRFALATLVLVPYVLWTRRARSEPPGESRAAHSRASGRSKRPVGDDVRPRPARTIAHLKDGVIVGVFLFAGYAFQTAGLQYTTAGRAGFITGLAVLLVPFVAWLWLRRPPARGAVAGALFAVAGLGLMMAPALQSEGLAASPTLPVAEMLRGDVLVLACAFAFALHITAIGRVSEREAQAYDPAALAMVQIAVTALWCVLGALWLEGAFGVLRAGIPASVWFAAAFTGVLATALAFGVQTAAQAAITPERTALIFATEPLFAALFAWWLAGEYLGTLGWAGGALIVVGMVVGATEVPRAAAETHSVPTAS